MRELVMKAISPTSSIQLDAVIQNRWIKLAAVLAVCTLGGVAPSLIGRAQPDVQPLLSLNSDTLASPAILRLPVSLPNGTDIAPPLQGTGYSQLTIDNGNSVDAVAKLVDRNTGFTVRFVYVKARQKVILDELGAGSYDLRFALGTDWDEQQQRFRLGQQLTAFIDPLTFEETYEGNQVLWSTYTITLHPVTNGNARTEPIKESEF
jgi:hypothetical protein